MDEFARIDAYFAPLARDPGALGLRDDAALIAGGSLVITKDCMVAGVHFIGDEPPGLIARKLLRVNLSDLAAKGAKPEGYLLGIMAPSDTPPDWFAAFAHGLALDQDHYHISLLGGDTTATPGPLSLSLTAIGSISRPPMLRSDASAGDAIYVTGTLGDSAVGLAMLQGTFPMQASLVERYRLPEPRVPFALALHESGLAHACMDISDGLLQDAGHIARASGVQMQMEAKRLPLSKPVQAIVQQDAAHLSYVATGGDDYELLFTAAHDAEKKLQALAKKHHVPITRIGRVSQGSGVELRDANGVVLSFARKGYQHF